jgi:hypothetical protein
MRLVPILALSLAVLTLPAVAMRPAEAADLRVNASTRPQAPPPARTPSVQRSGDPGIERFDDRGRDHGHRPGHQRPVIIIPQTVFVTPNRCWQPGYWTYQFVPQSYSYSTWVAGQWSPDGLWIDGHYAPSVYNTGYYQPLWVEGYYC